MRLIPLQRFTLSFNRQKYSLQEGGFTLLEILVVLFLIVLIASLIGPKLVLKKNPGLKDISRKIVTESRLLYWEAVSSQKMIRLYYNLEKGTVTAVQIEPNGQKRHWKAPESDPGKCHPGVILTESSHCIREKWTPAKRLHNFFQLERLNRQQFI